jgi:hypothetical protein
MGGDAIVDRGTLREGKIVDTSPICSGIIGMFFDCPQGADHVKLRKRGNFHNFASRNFRLNIF